ncbi:YbjN domain-containing protein [Candidatus Poriferisodalis sp.]|uniref:YbjN domain-containing protein n=1 Tax=Candidatus Poriferisodalis sp. TaxID=3101277 RepID=UPI003B01D54F
MTRRPATVSELDALETRIDRWLAEWAEAQADDAAPDAAAPDAASVSAVAPHDRPMLIDVTRDDDIPRRWYVRLAGESRDVIAVWLTLRQRTLAYETYVLPTPPHRPEQVADFVLRRNYSLVGAQYGIGAEDAVFLTGELPTHCVDEDELDRIVGSLWAYVERDFTTLLRLGFQK